MVDRDFAICNSQVFVILHVMFSPEYCVWEYLLFVSLWDLNWNWGPIVLDTVQMFNRKINSKNSQLTWQTTGLQ